MILLVVLDLSPVFSCYPALLPEMWYQVFLWALFSSILVHCVAAAIAFARLRRHKIGRLVPALILVMGILSPITGGVVTSKSPINPLLPRSLLLQNASIGSKLKN